MFRREEKIRYIAGLDIGSSAVRIAVGHAPTPIPAESGLVWGHAPLNAEHASRHLQILGVATVNSEGIRRGAITSIEDVVSSLSNAFEQVEQITGIPVEAVIVGMNGPHIMTQDSRGVIAVAKANGEVTAEDTARAVAAAQGVMIPPNYDMVHMLPRSFSVDGQTGIKDPVGMTAMRLEVDAKIVYAATTHVKNVTRAVYRTGADIEDLVLGVLADAEIVTTPRQKELGVAVVNIGASTTSIAVYEEGDTVHVAVLPIGGEHVTNDIAIGLKTSIDVAEKMKIASGHCVPAALSKKDLLDVGSFGGSAQDVASRRYLSEIISARVTELFEKVNRELGTIGKSGMLPAGVFVTGGGAKIEGLAELGREVFQLPVAVGLPLDVASATVSLSDPSYATAIGLVKWGTLAARTPVQSMRAGKHAASFLSSLRKMKDWLMP